MITGDYPGCDNSESAHDYETTAARVGSKHTGGPEGWR